MVADVDLNFNENATDVTPNTLNSELPQSGQIGNMTYDPQTAAISGSYLAVLFSPIKTDLLHS